MNISGLSQGIGVTVLLAGVTGCATLDSRIAELDAKPPCCSDMAQFKYEPLEPGNVEKLQLGADSPAFTFPSGKSYFKAYKIGSAQKMRVRSFRTGSTAFETRTLSQIYCPQVTFLTAQHSPIRTEARVPERATGKLAEGQFWVTWVAEFEVPPAAAFAVLHSSKDLYGRMVYITTGGGAYLVGSTVVVDRGGQSIPTPCGPGGEAEVSLHVR